MTLRPLPTLAFAAAALTPLGLLALASLSGGLWVWLALIYMGVLPGLIDRLAPLSAGDAPEGAEFPASDAVLTAVGLGALVILPLGVLAIGSQGFWPGAALFLALGFWLGQVVHPAAHELIHRPGRGHFRLGVAAYVAILYGQHASAHRLVHHRHVGTDEDPNSARSGEGFYRFALRAWVGSFRQGWQAETALRARGTGGGLHPYAVYLGGAALVLALAYAMGGVLALAIWAGLGLHAQSQILVSDYVQHYGLRRVRVAGKPEPVGPAHSWNGGEWFSSAVMINAPRHSDHHAHPARPYPALRLPGAEEAPRLPWPLPIACMIALVPPLWKRRIRPSLQPWLARAAAREGRGG